LRMSSRHCTTNAARIRRGAVAAERSTRLGKADAAAGVSRRRRNALRSAATLCSRLTYEPGQARERDESAPPREPKARGSAAHGFFECDESLAQYTRAAFVSAKGKRRPSSYVAAYSVGR
jgi:hypothetical protein